jgi:nucleotide-binding universal stress UspA family protein
MKQTNNKTLDNIRLLLPSRIVVATDLTDLDRLLPHIVAQGKATGAIITLVHAIEPKECTSAGLGGPCCGSCEADYLDKERMLTVFAKEIEAQNLSCTWVLKRGFAADIVRRQIELTHTTRLIMASHGRGKFGQFVLGSVANQLLCKVTIPIFLVGPRSEATADHCTPRRILHPVSMNGDYKRSANVAIGLAELYKAEVIMLHIPDRDIERSLQAGFALNWAEKLFEELVAGDGPNPQVKVSVAFGDRVEQIRKEAVRIHADWIVLGVEEGFSVWPLPESTAYRTMAVADCPVLVIPHQSATPQTAEETTFMAVI